MKKHPGRLAENGVGKQLENRLAQFLENLSLMVDHIPQQ